MYLPSFAGTRIAPAHYHEAPTLRGHNFWNGLVWAVVPDIASNVGAQYCGRELVRRVSNAFNGGVIRRGEPNGPAMLTVGAALTFPTSPLPSAAPFSIFSFLVNRGSTTGQSLVAARGITSGGWTFQFAYPSGTGNIGLTRWGVADNPSTGLGAVPTGGAPSCLGMSLSGSTVRFFLNGRFQNIASGSPNAPVGGVTPTAFGGGTPMTNASVYCVYVWNRAVSDGEFFALMQDPWAPVRPPELPFAFPTAAAVGGGSRVQVAGFVG